MVKEIKTIQAPPRPNTYQSLLFASSSLDSKLSKKDTNNVKSRSSNGVSRVPRRLLLQHKSSVLDSKTSFQSRSGNVIHVSVFGKSDGHHITRKNKVSASNNQEQQNSINTVSVHNNSQLFDRNDQQSFDDKNGIDGFVGTDAFSDNFTKSWPNLSIWSMDHQRILSAQRKRRKKKKNFPVFSRPCCLLCCFCCLISAILLGTLIAALILKFTGSNPTTNTTSPTSQVTITSTTITTISTTTATTTTVTSSSTTTSSTVSSTSSTTTETTATTGSTTTTETTATTGSTTTTETTATTGSTTTTGTTATTGSTTTTETTATTGSTATTLSETTSTTVSTTTVSTICPTTSITTVVTSSPLPNECTNYTLDTDPTRNAAYANINDSCDSSAFPTSPAWVRFSGAAGTILASCPIDPQHCNTRSTGWYSGVYPSTAGGTTVGTVCYNWYGDSCVYNNTISVTNCNGYYVYFLINSFTCNIRYCTI